MVREVCRKIPKIMLCLFPTIPLKPEAKICKNIHNVGLLPLLCLANFGNDISLALRQHVELHYSSDNCSAVLVAVPTGVAAANMDGVAVHKLLKLPVSKSTEAAQFYWPLHPQDVKILRMMFRNVRLLIIDEISMLSNLYLMFIHKRLNEVLIEEDKYPYAGFCNLHVMLLGDLSQLLSQQTITNEQIECSFRSLGANIWLWQMYQFAELSENKRQRDDAVYASMLDRIRIGSPTVEDLALLRSSRIHQPQVQNDLEWQELLNVAVDRFLDILKNESYAT